MVGLELAAVSARNGKIEYGGASRDRTDDLIVANDALSQLSYSPTSEKNVLNPILPAMARARKIRAAQRTMIRSKTVGTAKGGRVYQKNGACQSRAG